MTATSSELQRQFRRHPGKSFFAFPYGWRRDYRVAARRLKEQTNRWLREWRREQPDAKLILVGHSMGGLVARYFLECLEGWRDTRRLVTFGTPYRGCPGEPCTGAGPQLPAPPAVLPAATGRRPSIYKN